MMMMVEDDEASIVAPRSELSLAAWRMSRGVVVDTLRGQVKNNLTISVKFPLSSGIMKAHMVLGSDGAPPASSLRLAGVPHNEVVFVADVSLCVVLRFDFGGRSVLLGLSVERCRECVLALEQGALPVEHAWWVANVSPHVLRASTGHHQGPLDDAVCAELLRTYFMANEPPITGPSRDPATYRVTSAAKRGDAAPTGLSAIQPMQREEDAPHTYSTTFSAFFSGQGLAAYVGRKLTGECVQGLAFHVELKKLFPNEATYHTDRLVPLPEFAGPLSFRSGSTDRRALPPRVVAHRDACGAAEEHGPAATRVPSPATGSLEPACTEILPVRADFMRIEEHPITMLGRHIPPSATPYVLRTQPALMQLGLDIATLPAGGNHHPMSVLRRSSSGDYLVVQLPHYRDVLRSFVGNSDASWSEYVQSSVPQWTVFIALVDHVGGVMDRIVPEAKEFTYYIPGVDELFWFMGDAGGGGHMMEEPPVGSDQLMGSDPIARSGSGALFGFVQHVKTEDSFEWL